MERALSFFLCHLVAFICKCIFQIADQVSWVFKYFLLLHNLHVTKKMYFLQIAERSVGFLSIF